MSPDLCIGTTLLALRWSGKTPVERLRLKICASGRSISLWMALSSLELIPSMSVLLLLTSVLMVLPTRICPQPSSSSSLAVSGNSAQYDNGSVLDGGSELAILDPTVEKKLLNVFAIALVSEDRVPSIDISEIVCVLLLRLAASLRMFHVLFAFLLDASESS